MKPSAETLGEILHAPSQYVIPVFQRNYRWEMPQWAKFWDSEPLLTQQPRNPADFLHDGIEQPQLVAVVTDVPFRCIDTIHLFVPHQRAVPLSPAAYNCLT